MKFDDITRNVEDDNRSHPNKTKVDFEMQMTEHTMSRIKLQCTSQNDIAFHIK